MLLAPVLLCWISACPSPGAASVPRAPGNVPSSVPASEFDHTHALWTELLRAHVRDQGVDYAALKIEPSRLERYLAALHAVTPDELSHWGEKQRFAFWINVYNAHTVQKVVQHYPLESIRDLDKALGLKTVFEQRFIPMRAFHPERKDEDLSLNDIEHGILRAQFKDARLHAAINCASKSCPPLRNEAYVAERLDEQLDQQMRGFINDTRFNRFDRKKGRLELSEIFKWFKEDFERDAGSVKEYVIRFVPDPDAEAIREAKISYIDYDWGLNDVTQN